MSAPPRLFSAGLVTLDAIVDPAAPATAIFRAGGTAGNVAAIMSGLGIETWAFGRIGSDVAGVRLLRDMRRHSVRTRFVRARKETQTPTIVEVLPHGRTRSAFRFFCTSCRRRLPRAYPPSQSDLRAASQMIKRSDVFFFDRPWKALVEFAETAATRGALVMFEPASHPRSPLFARALSAASVIKFSRDRVARAELLTGHAAALADKLVLETLDGNGVRFRMPKRSVWHRREPFTAARILDTTGAGDWFSAGLLYQVARRAGSRLAFANVKPAVDFAQMLAAASIGFRGARGYQDYCSGPKILSLVEGIGMVGKPTPLGEEGESSIEPAEGTDCPVCLRTLVQSDPGASTN